MSEDESSRETEIAGLRDTFERMVTEEAWSPHDDEENRPMIESLIVMRDEEGNLETGWMDIGLTASSDTDRSELAIAVRDNVSKAIRELEDEFRTCGVHEGTGGIFYSEREKEEGSQ